MKNLSVVLIVHNEADNLKTLLGTLRFASEIIVLDNDSLDQTAAITKSFGAKHIRHILGNDFANARNFALRQTKSDWVLFLDADERLSPELVAWLERLEPQNNVSAYAFRRIDHFWNRELRFGETGRTFVTRLVNKRKGQFERPVHETWTGKPIKEKNLVIDHFPHPTIKTFLEHINFYSDINAHYFYVQKRKTSVLDLIFTPLLKFFYTYFVRLGFLDGPAGFVYSFMMSFHSFLTRAKLYTLQDK